MATLTMTIPDAVLPDLLDALTIPYGWTKGQGPKAAFAKETLRSHLRDIVRNWRIEQARVTAAATEAATVDTATAGIGVA